MNKWTCGHTAHGTCSRCNSVLAWQSHLLIEIADDAIEELGKHNIPAAETLRKRIVAAINYKGEA